MLKNQCFWKNHQFNSIIYVKSHLCSSGLDFIHQLDTDPEKSTRICNTACLHYFLGTKISTIAIIHLNVRLGMNQLGFGSEYNTTRKTKEEYESKWRRGIVTGIRTCGPRLNPRTKTLQKEPSSTG